MESVRFYANLKKILILIISLIFLINAACQKKPDAVDSHDNPIRLSEYRGKWLVVNYWATWCKPCLTELPQLNELSQQYANQLAVLGVNFDHLPPEEILRFAESFQLTFPLLSDFPIQKFGIKEIPTLPMTFIIDPQGKLSKILYGPQTKDGLLQNLQGSQ